MSKPEPGTRAHPTISVVLPVLNEEADIGRLLDEVLQQTSPAGGFEVLVVDGGSTDRTREIVARRAEAHANLRLLANPRRRSSAGRNVGVQAARGEYVLFLDGHCALPRCDYLVRAVELFRDTGAACLCRPQPLQDLASDPWGRAIAGARHSWLGHNPRSDIYRDVAGFTDPRSAGAAYVRKVIVELGGYDESFDACEDVEFNHRLARANYRSFLHPDLSVHYRPRNSLQALFRQMQRYGRGRARLFAKHPALVPWALVSLTTGLVGLTVAPLLVGGRTGGGAATAAIGLYLALVVAESARIRPSSAEAVRLATAFFGIHAGLLSGFWRGLLEFPQYRRRQPQAPHGR